MQLGQQPEPERGVCHKGVAEGCRRGAHRGARKERRPWKPAEPAAASAAATLPATPACTPLTPSSLLPSARAWLHTIVDSKVVQLWQQQKQRNKDDGRNRSVLSFGLITVGSRSEQVRVRVPTGPKRK